jgi:hypothetical protein
MHTKAWTSIAGLALVLTACSEQSSDPLSAVGPRSELHLGVPEVTGDLLGPDGTAICNFVPEGTQITLRAIEVNSLAFGGVADLICPESTYAMPLAAGSYLLRAQFVSTDGIGSFPWRTLTSSPITVDVEDVTQDIRIDLGTALGGRATLDDRPVPGVAFGVVYQSLPGFGAALGVSGADGGWTDFFGRTPIVLQDQLDYAFATGCNALLGTVVVQDFPVGPFRFPGDIDAVNCALRSGATEPLTHNFNAVVVTAMPGDLGGLSPDVDPRFGQGFGVQFPAVPGAAPAHRPLSESQWFRGGLMVDLESGAILTGFDPAGELECGASCRDLGRDGKLSVRRSPGQGKTVTWRYSDAPSAEGVGLQVVQQSYDAPAGRAYVLFRFKVKNTSAKAQTLSLGVFADWDVDATIGDDVGFVEHGGRLLSQSNADGPTTRLGTLVVGDAAPTPGLFFSTPFVPSLSDQAAALAGSLSQPPAGPADYRYIQSIAPLELRRGHSTEFWVAIVAGADASEFARTADAAFQDIQSRRHAPEPAVERGDAMALRHSEIRPGPPGGLITKTGPGHPCKNECVK